MVKSILLPKLLKGEKIVYVKNFEEDTPKHPISGLRAIEELTRAKNYEEIGKYGPVMAAESLKDHLSEREFLRYNAIFGRDSLRVAIDLIYKYPTLTKTTLIRLAELQGVEFNERREEEVGKIIHEYRDPINDPVARELTEQRGWDWPYYGSIDSTIEFIKTFAIYCNLYGFRLFSHSYKDRKSKKRKMSYAFDKAIDWILFKIESSELGFVEFKSLIPLGIENQAWKDSWDSYFHADGSIANHKYSIASIEVQASAYDALSYASDIYEKHFKNFKKALKLKIKAKILKDNILKFFWTEDKGGYFVLGLDRDDHQNIRKLKIRTSNMGHLLNSQLFLDEDTNDYVKKIIKQLFSKELLSYSGIRTLASDEIRFRPGAYHNGSVWIWDNYLIIQGLEKHGYFGLARLLEKIILEDVDSVKRFPEYFRGDLSKTHYLNNRIVEIDDTINHKINRIEQPPQDVQAWTAASIIAIKIEKKLPLRAEDEDKFKFEEKILKNVWF